MNTQMNEKLIVMFQRKFAQCMFFLLPFYKKLIALTTHDRQWVIIILFCALILRLPFIAHPDVTQFDEVTYVNFTLHTLNNQPFFDIHPPLLPMLFAAIARGAGPITIFSIPETTNQPFGDFPFVTLRYVTAMLGSLLPLLIYAIGRILKYPPRIAALPALFIVADSAFIIYSRTILPETLFLLLNFLALGSALAMFRVKQRKLSLALLVTGSIAMGCALSIKWLALGMLAVIWLLFLSERRYGAIITSGLIALMTYVTIFTAFFFYFPEGGHPDPRLSVYDIPAIHNISFPETRDLSDVLTFLPKYHQAMLRINNDKGIAAHTFPSPGPLTWPASRSSIDFWRGEDGKKITFQGNALLWMVSLLLLSFHVGWICWHVWNERKWSLEKDETILLVGYALNYLPFFFIHRPMYLYHYFTALIFLFLMIPKIAPRMIRCIAVVTKDRPFAVTLACFTLLLIALDLMLSLPIIYGF
jgi:dolichyl-phosphate-mannose--protein O-mannosyl transferase